MADQGLDENSAFSFPENAKDTYSKLKEDWTNFLYDPRGQAALLSFGTQLLQPPQWGQGNAGLFGSAIGQAGAGVRAVDEQERKDMEAQSKANVRESQAQLAESKAQNATTQGDYRALDREYRKERDAAVARTRTQQYVQNKHSDHVKAVAAENAAIAKDFLNPKPPKTPMSFEQFLNSQPQLKQMWESTLPPRGEGSQPNTETPDTSSGATSPPTTEAPTTPATPPTTATPSKVPVALPPLKDRKAGQVYPTTMGNMMWTGKDWIEPPRGGP